MSENRSPLQFFRGGKQVGTIALALVAAGILYLLYANQPSPALELIDKGKKLADLGHPEEAVTQWKEAAKYDPKNTDVLKLLGDAYRNQGAFEAAIDPYRRLAALKPETPGIVGLLGSCVIRSENSDSANEQALKDLEKNPNDVGALTIAAFHLTYRDDQKQYLGYLRRLEKLLPNDGELLTTLAKKLVDTRSYQEAVVILERLVTLTPDNPAAYDLRGLCRLRGDGSPQALAQAETDFQKAIELKSPSPYIHLNLGRTYIGMNKAEKAVSELLLATSQLPFKPDVYFELSRAYALAGQQGKAATARAKFSELRALEDRLNSLSKRCNAFPDNFAYHLELAQLLLKVEDLGKAEYYVSRAIELRPNDAGAKAVVQQFRKMAEGMRSRP